MLRRFLISVTILALVSAAAGQTQDSNRRTRGPVHAPLPQTLRLLNQRIPEVAFEDAPFEQVMEWVAEFTRSNVVVRWPTLEDAGIERDKPISIRVRNLRLSQVLWMIMNEAGGSDLKLAYRASGNLLIMSTEEDLAREMIVKIYDVSDLLVRVPRYTNAARLDPAQALNQLGQGGGGGGGGGSQQLFQTEGGQNDNNDDQGGGIVMDELVQLITDTVEPDSWVDNGGLGTIQALRGQLVVRNTILVHQRLGGYVEDTTVGP
ncbi:MAG: hypothetical protein KKB50_02875 [Planctomycetes bacterium]|nr:hypothetical protein [Planctomycetota bacterium]